MDSTNISGADFFGFQDNFKLDIRGRFDDGPQSHYDQSAERFASIL